MAFQEVHQDVRWIYERCEAAGFSVGRFVPTGFESYCQLRHPLLVPPSVAAEENLPTLPATSHGSFARVAWRTVVNGDQRVNSRRVAEALDKLRETHGSEAWLGSVEVASLVQLVGPRTGVSLYWDIVSSGDWVEALRLATAAQWLHFVRAHESEDDPQMSPTYVWPTDKSWVLWTSPDLMFSVVASDERQTLRLLRDPTVEACGISIFDSVPDL